MFVLVEALGGSSPALPMRKEVRVQAGKIINKAKELSVIQRASIAGVARGALRAACNGGDEEPGL